MKMMTDEKRQIRKIAQLAGRAISLSVVAAQTRGSYSTVEDEAIAAMDRAWSKLADSVIEFAEDE